MTDTELLELVGATIYGPHWSEPLAEALGVSGRSMRYWRAGSPVPAGVWDSIFALAALRIGEIDDAMTAIAENRGQDNGEERVWATHP